MVAPGTRLGGYSTNARDNRGLALPFVAMRQQWTLVVVLQLALWLRFVLVRRATPRISQVRFSRHDLSVHSPLQQQASIKFGFQPNKLTFI